MNKVIKRISVFMMIMMLALTATTTSVCAKNGFNQKPGSDVGFKEDKKSNGQKVKAPGGSDYGWRDTKGRVWVPDGKMHGGQEFTQMVPMIMYMKMVI
ncbi:polymorphic toxin type 37 domain-containing protein [[Clostridium] polysaccharolyticum]|uniref:Uncharacterized protein n=1 Tax=[Clostridium] polysaccharolyticum TaxID=29364 RepID=A0A1I0C7F5_9FIRM|nr:hypothetical protein [[Clostridium] polysaccharolyticum]SET15472.1 hypothetical protein SAMN04487772_10969 [[Clostridium] polysaccharolyticum]